jgi:hypothetical protein
MDTGTRAYALRREMERLFGQAGAAPSSRRAAAIAGT